MFPEISPALRWLFTQFPDGVFFLPDPLQTPLLIDISHAEHLQTPPRTQCRVRLWALHYPDQPLQECIPHLLGGGLEFRMLSSLPPHPLSLPPLHL